MGDERTFGDPVEQFQVGGYDLTNSTIADGRDTTPLGGTVEVTLPAPKLKLQAPNFPRGYIPSASAEGISSASQGSDKQLGSPRSQNDRVFPIRSVVGMDSSQAQTPFHGPKPPGSSPRQDYFPSIDWTSSGGRNESRASPQSQRTKSGRDISRGRTRQGSISINDGYLPEKNESAVLNGNDSSRYGGGSRMHIFSDASSEKSNAKTESSYTGHSAISMGASTPGDALSINGYMTARFKHITTAEGHAVITGRDGDALQRCEDEPIHIPGAVQSFGMLIALEEKEDGQLLVRIVSENSCRMIGYTPHELFRLGSFTDILSEEQEENLLDHVDFIRDEEADPAANGPEVFTLTVKMPRATGNAKRSHKLWCAMHINPANPELIIVEFELDDDPMYPLVPPDCDTPEPPENTLNSNPSQEEYVESTHAMSKPLRVLRSARKRKGEAAAMEVFNIMSQVQEQLSSATTLENFLKILVGVVKELTGFHRVMIYQFDATFNGRVVTELVDPRATKDLYKGLNFPASDIPKQARDLYKTNKVRLLYDRDLETTRLVCRTTEDLETPLDLSYAYLRAMSPIHLKYLKNMAVRSSMSISINAFANLWGLVSCHGYGSSGLRVSFPIRKMCRMIGDTASRTIEKLSYASRLQARKLINTVPTEANPSGYIIASSDDLLKLFDADFGMLSIKGETKIMGKVDHTQEALVMLEYLRMRKITSVVTSHDIRESFPDLVYSPGFVMISGILLVPLSISGSDFIVFFRKGAVREVRWAGNPYEKFIKAGTAGYLEPRTSFKTWSEIVVGKCREWTEEQVETAAVLCLVWRQKEAALQSSQLTKLLLANSAHEVRTPLNAIINYLEIAMEGALDQETRDNLSKSHSASKSLIYVINDLLDLTKTEEGQELIKDEIFDLPLTIRETINSFKGDAKRKGIEYEIIEHTGVPQLVYGDQRRVRQVVSNITANAVQNTFEGFVRVEIWQLQVVEGRAIVEIVVQDSGVGMSNEKLDAIFRCLEQVTTDEDEAPMPSSGNTSISEVRKEATLGLGMAIVARIIRNMDGQLRLKSEEGKGSRFVIQLSFLLPDGNFQSTRVGQSSPAIKTNPDMITAGQPSTPSVHEGEVTLVEKGSSLRADGISHKRSVEEINSMRSFRSNSSGARSNKSRGSKASNKSDVDRMIDAISGSLGNKEGGAEEPTQPRAGHSRGSSSITAVRPGELKQRKSYSSGQEQLEIRIASDRQGGIYVHGEKTPLRAVRMPDEFSQPVPEETCSTSKASIDIPHDRRSVADASETEGSVANLGADQLEVLVAEDDPINSRIIRKRLEKSGHHVYHTVNGEECARAYEQNPKAFDLVLMDMQMPIVDGLTSTKMIRSMEKSTDSPQLSNRASVNGRIPIFAVSASLVERNRQEYIAAEFDGWILKPIDFKRLSILMQGIVDDSPQSACLYRPGHWEHGGWFHARQPIFTELKVAQCKVSGQHDGVGSSEKGSSSSSGSGSITPMPDSKEHVLGGRANTLLNLVDDVERDTKAAPKTDDKKIDVDGASRADISEDDISAPETELLSKSKSGIASEAVPETDS
ncbi:PHY1, histidine kinase-group VIII protein [Calycina marina]|uniref:PHY1, histidine kinase-group VIII protein n=1 Tax=Calycina marina TaxID=1763456 RepID=A0A9P8CHB4_9HELO|nr:PHY1, histidine kinase-group VIII protein [Calycina marina]